MTQKTKKTKNPWLAIIIVLASLTFTVDADISLGFDFTVEEYTTVDDLQSKFDGSKDKKFIKNYKLKLNAGANGDGKLNVIKDSK